MSLVKFLHEAEVELLEIVVYYEEQAYGLGADFYDEVKHAIGDISLMPDAWSPRADGTRRYLLHRFPYVVVYCCHDEYVWVLGIRGTSQRPLHWQQRIGQTRSRR